MSPCESISYDIDFWPAADLVIGEVVLKHIDTSEIVERSSNFRSQLNLAVGFSMMDDCGHVANKLVYSLLPITDMFFPNDESYSLIHRMRL